MQTVIFGRPGCPYCVRAKDLAEKLSNEHDDFQYHYVDIRAEGITCYKSLLLPEKNILLVMPMPSFRGG